MTCSLKLVTVSSHLRNGNLVALLNMFFQLQLNFCCVKILTQLQQRITLIWCFCIHKALLKYLNSVKHYTELRGRQVSLQLHRKRNSPQEVKVTFTPHAASQWWSWNYSSGGFWLKIHYNAVEKGHCPK